MYVLFSPIGNSDPWRDFRDGAMLHIVRHYQPKKVVLFFTKSIYEGNETSHAHKMFDWNRIIKQVSNQSEVEIIVRDIENPQDYDVFKDDFHHVINTLHKEYKNYTVLLNVTSGTPQMGATLCLEYVTYPENKIAVQVSTPKRTSNANVGYDTPNDVIETLQMVNELEQNEKPRYSEIKIISFREAMWKSMAFELLSNYDYVGAREIFKKLKKDKAVQLLSEKIEDINKQRIFPDIDKRYNLYNLKKAICHFLVLKMRFDQKNYSDVLIRIKSITEFLCQEFLIENNIIKRSSDKNIEFIDNKYSIGLNKDKYGNVLKTLNSLIIIFETNNLNSTILQHAKEVHQINDDRNKVAHNLEALDLEYSKLELAFNAVKSLMKIIYTDIKEKDYYYFENFNEIMGKHL